MGQRATLTEAGAAATAEAVGEVEVTAEEVGARAVAIGEEAGSARRSPLIPVFGRSRYDLLSRQPAGNSPIGQLDHISFRIMRLRFPMVGKMGDGGPAGLDEHREQHGDNLPVGLFAFGLDLVATRR